MSDTHTAIRRAIQSAPLSTHADLVAFISESIDHVQRQLGRTLHLGAVLSAFDDVEAALDFAYAITTEDRHEWAKEDQREIAR